MQSYEALVRCAAAACDMPMASLALVERDRARFKASFGAKCAEELPLTFSLLAETLACDGIFTVQDALADPRFASSPVVISGPRVRFYAAAALRDESGRPAGILAVADTSPRRASEQMLSAFSDFVSIAAALVSKARELDLFRAALDDAGDCISIHEFGSDGTPGHVYVNDYTVMRTGFTRDEFLKQSSAIVVGPLSDPELLASVRADMLRGVARQIELPVYCKDGSYFWAEARCQPLPDEDGKVRRYLTICRDVSERRESERLVRLLTRAIDEALDLVLVSDSELPSSGGPFIQYVNKPLLAATGYELEELTGKPYTLLMAPENDPMVLQTIVDNLELMHDLEKEIMLRRKDGSAFWVEFTSRPLIADGKATHWVAVGRDITARRQTHQQMAALVKAIDSVSDHLEIYAWEGGAYVPAFQNAASDADASLFVETILNQAEIREQLLRGHVVTLPNDGLSLRPLGPEAETVICVRAQPQRFAAAS